jgi:serine/threonine protein kinase
LYKLDNTRHLVTYFYQILEAVSYLHDNFIAHLDLKLENIILNTNTNVIKIIDFGESVIFNKNKEYIYKRGTLQYLPPEVIETDVIFLPYKVDIWCCGIIFYNLFYNKSPWDIADIYKDMNYKVHFESIVYKNKCKQSVVDIKDKVVLNPILFPYNDYYSKIELDIVYNIFYIMLHPDPDKRKSIDFVKSIFGLINLT